MSLSDVFHKTRARTWHELALFVEAFFLLGLARIAILLMPLERITSILKLYQGTGTDVPSAHSNPLSETVSWAINAASCRTPWESTCLTKGLAGIRMLTRRNISATLYLGVSINREGNVHMDAHAWLCSGRVIVTGIGDIERFAAVSSFSNKPSAKQFSPRNTT